MMGPLGGIGDFRRGIFAVDGWESCLASLRMFRAVLAWVNDLCFETGMLY